MYVIKLKQINGQLVPVREYTPSRRGRGRQLTARHKPAKVDRESMRARLAAHREAMEVAR